MTIKNLKKNRGFVILFAVTLSAILLAIALGVASVALKEVKFGTSAKDNNDAFFASDTGIECALINDKTASNSFVQSGGSGTVQCLGSSIPITGSYPSWNFVVSGLGSSGVSCANIDVYKDDTSQPPSIITNIISKGYNIGNAGCTSTNPDRVERELRTTYGGSGNSGSVSMTGQLTMTADNQYNAYFNGSAIGSGGDWSTSQNYPVTFSVGKNVIAVQATDWGGGFAGFLANITMGAVNYGSGINWKVSTTVPPFGWEQLNFDDSSWSNATDYGSYGVSPWFNNVSGMPNSTPGHWIWSNTVPGGGSTIYLRGTINN